MFTRNFLKDAPYKLWDPRPQPPRVPAWMHLVTGVLFTIDWFLAMVIYLQAFYQ